MDCVPERDTFETGLRDTSCIVARHNGVGRRDRTTSGFFLEMEVNTINKQVARAQRRLMTGKFFRILVWSAFAGLCLAAIGMAIPKIWYLDFLKTQDQVDAWTFSWIIGGAVLAFLVTAFLTWQQRESHLHVAVEVDKRFGLKERLSSALSLDDQTAASNVGQALIEDAETRADTIDVRDEFQFQPTWRALLPLIPVLILVGLMFVPNAEKQVVAVEAEKINKKRVEVAVKEFKKKIEEKRKELLAKGLKDVENLRPLEKKLDKMLDDKNQDKKEAMVQLNDIKKQIEDRRKELGNSKDLKESLNKLKDAGKGPAKELADAMSKGDMEQAAKAIKELADKLKEGKLNEIERKQLAKDLERMANELKKLAEKHEADKKKLEDQIKKALEQGDLDKAAKLQQQLENKQAQDKQNQQMKKMAEKLQKCADCNKAGKNGQPKQGQKDGKQAQQNSEQQAQAMKEAAQQLEDLAEQIQEMGDALEELEALEDLEEMAEGCKQAMNLPGGNKQDDPKWQDWAKGEGIGGGKRDLEKEDTGSYKSRVKGKLSRGETLVTGNADGKNLTGRSVSETQELVRDSMSKETDPLENIKLSKTAREHAQQYFKQLRDRE